MSLMMKKLSQMMRRCKIRLTKRRMKKRSLDWKRKEDLRERIERRRRRELDRSLRVFRCQIPSMSASAITLSHADGSN